jgi:hypothetical protein
MAGTRCSCGFTEDANADYTIGDHLLAVFAPDDGKGQDGNVHLEGEIASFCLCGAGGSAEKLDLHFAEVFTPADSAGRDGVIHKAEASRG